MPSSKFQKMDQHGKSFTAEYNAHNQMWQMAGGKGAHPRACTAGGSGRVGMTLCSTEASGDRSKV